MTISEDRADRIEDKVDTLISAVNRLAIIDERQMETGRRMGLLEEKVAKLESEVRKSEQKLDKWINMGVGAWGFVGFIFAMYQTFRPSLGH